MTLEALLTFCGLLAAAVAIMGAVQRKALLLFVPKWLVPAASCAALILLVMRDAPFGVPPPFGWRLDRVIYFLALGSFLLPISSAIIAWWLWSRARLSSRNLPYLEDFLHAALREGEFDEVERVLRRNRHTLTEIPPNAATALFSPRLVHQMVATYSFIHLQLLAHRPFLESLGNRLQAVDVVVRELLVAESSPLQAAVVNRFGGIEHLQYTDIDKTLIESTFEEPDWYHDTYAHYPLIITVMNVIESGTFDDAYNRVDENYVATQGISKRAKCPLFLASKTEVMALYAAVGMGSEKDFYISDLWQIVQKIYSRSKYDRVAAESTLGIYDPYTPYSFLLNEIMNDFENLTEEAVRKSVEKEKYAPQNAKPARTGKELVRFWFLSLWEVMGRTDAINPAHLDAMVERYFRFMFALGWQPSEILYTSGQSIPHLNVWRDLLCSQIKDCTMGIKNGHFIALHRVFGHLDGGKTFISDGYEWLKTQLQPQLFP
jgi:hypothetical protein